MTPPPIFRRLRAGGCMIVLAAASFAAAAICLVGRSLIRNAHRGLNWRNRCFRSWALTVAGLMQMEVKVAGTLPQPPFLLVANHLSYVDVVALATQIHGVFVAKGEVAKWPLLGWSSRMIGTIFIDRDVKRSVPEALVTMQRHYTEGHSLVFFPEGTTSSGATVGPFKPALLEFAIKNQLPVHYAAIRYRANNSSIDAGQVICWWGEMPFFPHLFRLFQIGGFTAEVIFGSDPILGTERKALAEALEKAVQIDLSGTVERKNGTPFGRYADANKE